MDINLIPLNESHFSILEKWNFDEVVTEFFSERPIYNADYQLAWFKRQLADSSKSKFVIQENISGKLIGIVSLMKIDLINKNAEIGITIGENDFLKKGFAKQAMEQLMQMAFNQMGLKTVYLTVFENNISAINLFTKLGFKKEGILKNRILKKGSLISLISMSIDNK